MKLLAFSAKALLFLLLIHLPCFQEIEGEKFYDEKLRIDLLAVLCRLGHNECNEYSVYLLDEWMSLPNPDEENPIPVSTMCKANKRGM